MVTLGFRWEDTQPAVVKQWTLRWQPTNQQQSRSAAAQREIHDPMDRRALALAPFNSKVMVEFKIGRRPVWVGPVSCSLPRVHESHMFDDIVRSTHRVFWSVRNKALVTYFNAQWCMTGPTAACKKPREIVLELSDKKGSRPS